MIVDEIEGCDCAADLFVEIDLRATNSTAPAHTR